MFVLFLEVVWREGVLLYGSRQSAVTCVPRYFFASSARFARDGPSSKRSGGVGNRKPLLFFAHVIICILEVMGLIVRWVAFSVYSALAFG